MKGINLEKCGGFTQSEDDFCIFACIENIFYYYDKNYDRDQYWLASNFIKFINPITDSPYFKYFALHIKDINSELRGKYNLFNSTGKLFRFIKANLKKAIPVMLSLKSSRKDRAHIVIACQYDDNNLKYFDPSNYLKDNFIIKQYKEIEAEFQGTVEFDTLRILPIKKSSLKKG